MMCVSSGLTTKLRFPPLVAWPLFLLRWPIYIWPGIVICLVQVALRIQASTPSLMHQQRQVPRSRQAMKFLNQVKNASLLAASYFLRCRVLGRYCGSPSSGSLALSIFSRHAPCSAAQHHRAVPSSRAGRYRQRTRRESVSVSSPCFTGLRPWPFRGRLFAFLAHAWRFIKGW